MIQVQEVIVVEGKYDKIKLSSFIDGLILQTDGFGIFKDADKMALLQRLAKQRGVLVLTDSDGAGFVIRGHLSSCIAPENIRHAYIPDIPGKESRKVRPSKEGKLGVEGVQAQLLEQAIRASGAHIIGEETVKSKKEIDTRALYRLGLTGCSNSSTRRKRLQHALQLPEKLSTPALLQVLNCIMTLAQLQASCEQLFTEQNKA